MRFPASAAFTCVLALATSACAHLGVNQHVAPPEPGRRIRVQVPSASEAWQAGTLIALTPDSLVLDIVGEGETWGEVTRTVYAIPKITRVEESSGVHNHVIDGAYIGANVGMMATLLGYPTTLWDPGGSEFWGVTIGCMIGGAVIGSTVRTENWWKRPLRSIHVSVPPGHDGAVVGATLTF